MKILVISALIFAAFGVSADVQAQQLGLYVVPPSTNTGDREAIVITYTGLEDRQVQLFELSVPATSEAACLATTDFTAATPIPADRTSQTFGERKKVVIAFTKTERYARCHVIVGRSGVNLDDFNVIRANFGRAGLFDPQLSDADRTETNRVQSAGHIFRLEKHFN